MRYTYSAEDFKFVRNDEKYSRNRDYNRIYGCLKRSEKMSNETKALSISFRSDDGCIEHNNRDFFTDNVDKSRTPNNITYVKRDLRELYHELFDEALAEYNARQNRPDRQIHDYYEHIRKPFQYEEQLRAGLERQAQINAELEVADKPHDEAVMSDYSDDENEEMEM